MLVDLRSPTGVVRQVWGSALRANRTMADALTAATNDAIARGAGMMPFPQQSVAVAATAPAATRGEAAPILASVLVADDEHLNCKLVARWLGKQGVSVISVEDGKDVVEKCIKNGMPCRPCPVAVPAAVLMRSRRPGERYDVLLLDENMRFMNGASLLH